MLNLVGGGMGASVITWRRIPKCYSQADYLMVAGEQLNGFEVRHCGHPTANRPYYVVTGSGEIIERKFRTSAEAKAAAIAAMNGNIDEYLEKRYG